VEKLIWPGITGRTVTFVSVNPSHGFHWHDLGQDLVELGCTVTEGDMDYGTGNFISDSTRRVVAVVDIFDGWPTERYHRFSPRQYVDFIFSIREKTKGSSDETVFLLYQNSRALEQAEHGLSADVLMRLDHYFTLHSDIPPKRRRKQLKTLWNRIQQALLSSEH